MPLQAFQSAFVDEGTAIIPVENQNADRYIDENRRGKVSEPDEHRQRESGADRGRLAG